MQFMGTMFRLVATAIFIFIAVFRKQVVTFYSLSLSGQDVS